MNRRWFAAWCLGTGLVVASPCGISLARAELTKEQKSSYNRGRTTLNAVVNKLKMSERYQPSESGFERVLGEVEDKLQKGLEFVKDIPATEPEMVELQKTIDQIKAEVDKRKAALAEAKKGAAADNADLEKGLDGDKATMEALSQQIYAIREAMGENEKTDGLENWAKIKQDGDALLAKYDGKKGQSEAARKMVMDVRSFAQDMRMIRLHVQSFLKDLPEKIKQYVDEADQGTKGDPAANIGAFLGKARAARMASALLDKYELLGKAEGADLGLVPKERARIAAIYERIGKGKTAVVAKAELPPDVYAGGDKEKWRAAVKEAWLERNAKFPPLKIILSEKDWTRHTRWVLQGSAWVKEDYSSMQSFVVIKADDKTAHYYACYLFRDHLNNGRLKIIANATDGRPANWDQVVLLAKVK